MKEDLLVVYYSMDRGEEIVSFPNPLYIPKKGEMVNFKYSPLVVIPEYFRDADHQVQEIHFQTLTIKVWKP